MKYKVYHWDTFDNETILIDEFDILSDAVDFVNKRYAGRITNSGADRVDIVDQNGDVKDIFHVK